LSYKCAIILSSFVAVDNAQLSNKSSTILSRFVALCGSIEPHKTPHFLSCFVAPVLTQSFCHVLLCFTKFVEFFRF